MIGREQLEAAVADYKNQLATTQSQIQQLDANYAQQREAGVNTANQIQGAIVALEQLLTVVDAPVPEVPQTLEAPKEEPLPEVTDVSV